MNIYTLRRLLVLLLVAGLAYGGWWAYTRRGGIKTLLQNVGIRLPGTVAAAAPGASPPAVPTPDAGNAANPTNPAPSVAPTNPDGEIVLSLITSATKKDWLQGEIDRFNQENKGQFHIETRFLETREAMQAILNDKEKPVLWSPSSPVWAARLGEAYEERKGERIVDMNDSDSFRIYLRSPLVFLTTKQKATFLRPLLAGPDGWKNIGELGAGTRKTPWGKFKFSHADPIASNSGFLTLALMLNDYGKKTGMDPSSEKTASSEGFVTYLRQVEKGLVFDIPAKEGSSPLTKAFAQDTSLYDMIVTYESGALGALETNPTLSVIYPEPTVIAEQSVLLVNGAWVTSEQREAARRFLAFLNSKESLENGLKSSFRTAQSSGPLSLTDALAHREDAGLRQGFTSVELPRYAALNEAALQWRTYIAPK